ncbi:glucosyl-3-phosphoglycerate synthase [Nocardia yunnanensis]|uniref:Glucosyl-3-phosphoglycerate synthase n=1 Tax=Nocardia yunnanensis TaxID=2382165 RepID=A0A386ZE54_9NOCA|nr:glucosyl-3-phosphoglycerate synthase [Nocardia yunnanensis]AYF75463.1 glucosyl-3-phosphoglycerate synthase [Nocardia yunnanensis]
MTLPANDFARYERPWTLPELIDRKDGRGVSVVLPALNEENTVAGVIESIRPLLGGLVDEILVVDSGSTDRTRARARGAGARVYTLDEALPGLPSRPGKGEVLWRSLAVAGGDLIVFIDSDLVAPDPKFVPALVAPLLFEDHLRLVKGCYRRALHNDSVYDRDGGGRVTQLVARPLLAALAPALAELAQPLGGEYAATRGLLTSIPFAPGYGVEIGILIDCWRRHGLCSITEVDLGARVHRNRPIPELAAMSRQVIATLLHRLDIPDSGAPLPQFERAGSNRRRFLSEVGPADRPPMATVANRPIASLAL